MEAAGRLRLQIPSGKVIEFLLPALFYDSGRDRTFLVYRAKYTFVETQLIEMSPSVSTCIPGLIDNMKSEGFKIFIVSGRITSVIEMLVTMEAIE